VGFCEGLKLFDYFYNLYKNTIMIKTRIGCHVSIAGGIENAPGRAAEFGCEVFQLFSRSPQGGPAPKLTPEVVQKFKNEMKKAGQAACYIHTPYYINLCSVKPETRSASIRIIREELERGTLIGAKYIMTHMGSAGDTPREEALAHIRAGVQKVLDSYKGTTQLLIEISAGSGNVMGDTFEELAYIVNKDKRVGVCIDSAHMFGSGYDIKTEQGFKKTVNVIKKTIGLSSIKLIHSNDSKVDLASHKDRHDHIGYGKIGKDGFKFLMKTFPKLDFILETEHDKVKEDIKTLKNIRKALS
jgi:deoxyribonuclease IV